MSNVTRVTKPLHLIAADPIGFDWLSAGYHRMTGTPDGAIFADVDGKRYRLVTWYGASHFNDGNQVWIHRDDFKRNEWIEVEPEPKKRRR